ncbi:MAG TPA: hypothetical protein VGS41_18660, partial [Chthonomonadales bacterium]|nr:hypothetical protein [Chthonomonadales bacterium]
MLLRKTRDLFVIASVSALVFGCGGNNSIGPGGNVQSDVRVFNAAFTPGGPNGPINVTYGGTGAELNNPGSVPYGHIWPEQTNQPATGLDPTHPQYFVFPHASGGIDFNVTDNGTTVISQSPVNIPAGGTHTLVVSGSTTATVAPDKLQIYRIDDSLPTSVQIGPQRAAVRI